MRSRNQNQRIASFPSTKVEAVVLWAGTGDNKGFFGSSEEKGEKKSKEKEKNWLSFSITIFIRQRKKKKKSFFPPLVSFLLNKKSRKICSI